VVKLAKILPWCAGLATLLLLIVVCLWEYYPPIAGPQRLTVSFPSPLPVGTSEPLVITGAPGAADFFFVRYLDARTVSLAYDSWGHGGPASPPLVVTPGARHVLEIQLPSLAALPRSLDPPTDRLRVSLDGSVVLDASVAFHPRRPLRAFFARNPFGGTSCGPEFRGQLLHADGRALAGDARTYFTPPDRFRAWLWFGRWQLLATVLLAAAVTWLLRRLSASPALLLPLSPSRLLPSLLPHRAFVATAALCSLAFTALLTNGTFRLIAPESFTNFYDFQALSLLQGRLDVPEGSLQGEAFIFDGKVYGYFGLTPALLRLPFVIFDLAFGELSRAAMLGYYAAALVGAYLLLLHATRLLRPAQTRPATWQTVLFTLHVGLGSTVFFLGSRAYIYHEAILCGIVFALFSSVCSLRFLQAPASRWWLGALALGIFSVHARPPTGLFALTVLGCVAATHLLRSWSAPKIENPNSKIQNPLRPLAIGALSVLGVLSFNALSYAKFRTIEGCPLRLNVQYSPARLAKIDSQQFHLGNVPYGVSAYLLRPTFEFSSHFPWIYLGPFLPTADFPSAKMDLPERTAALPFGMTGLFALATVGGVWACRRHPAARAPVLVLWASSVPLSLAMFAAIATAERYTGDWVPFLVCAAAFGLAAPAWSRLAATALAVATLWSCALTLAMALHYQGDTVWGVPDSVKQNYRDLRTRIDRVFLAPPPPTP
jgi:hypothetical protein